MKKNNSSKDEKDGKDDKGDKQKALFVQRLVAYLIDIFIVAFVATLISFPFMDIKKMNSLSEDLIKINSKYSKQEIDVKEYTAESNNISYNVSRISGPLSIATIGVSLIYFVVYQLYRKGQTLGKKLMKIRVVSDIGDLDVNQLIFRSFIANSILLKIIDLSFIIFASRNVYFSCIGFFQSIQYAIMLVSIVMVMYSKEGLAVHDKLFHTRVVRI